MKGADEKKDKGADRTRRKTSDIDIFIRGMITMRYECFYCNQTGSRVSSCLGFEAHDKTDFASFIYGINWRTDVFLFSTQRPYCSRCVMNPLGINIAWVLVVRDCRKIAVTVLSD